MTTRAKSGCDSAKEKAPVSRGRYSETLVALERNKIIAMYHVMGFPDVCVTTAVRDFDPQVEVTFQIAKAAGPSPQFWDSGDNGLDASRCPLMVSAGGGKGLFCSNWRTATIF